jgi:type I restriction enzyme S subunit
MAETDEIPEGWTSAQLGDVCQPRRAMVLPDDLQDLPYIGLEHIESGAISVKTWGHSSEVRSAKNVFEPGDVLYGKLRPYLDKAVLASFRGVCSTELIPLQGKPNRLDSMFLTCLVHSRPFIQHAIDTTGGTNLPRTSWNSLKELSLSIPPLAEQQAIAHVLRTVQRAKEATEKVIAAARQLKQSLMRHLFTYGPVRVEEADQVPQRETDYGAVPETWRTMPLSECAVVQTGVAKGRKLNGAEAISVPYLRVANVQDGYLDLSEIKTIEIRRSELSRFSLETGDVVLTEGGDFDKLGRGFIWNGEVPGCVHQNHIFAVRANRDLLMPEFLAYLTQSAYGKAYFLSVAHKTTNLACINTTKLKALPTLVPTKDEQKEIVASMKGVDQKLAIEERKRNALDLLFRTLLHHLMTGKVRVNELEFPAMKEGSP